MHEIGESFEDWRRRMADDIRAAMRDPAIRRKIAKKGVGTSPELNRLLNGRIAESFEDEMRRIASLSKTLPAKTTERLDRIVKAVGQKFVRRRMNRLALWNDLEWCAIWYQVEREHRLSKTAKTRVVIKLQTFEKA